jgi:predicted ATPase/DNA-binding XRE family transcriptional regulator
MLDVGRDSRTTYPHKLAPWGKDDDAGGPKLPSAMEDREQRSDSSDFGSLLRRYRLAAGLSQDALAERARVSANGISALERGRRRIPQRETLELLAGALALNAEQRRAFEGAAVRTSSPRRREGGSVTLGPWPSARLANLPLSLTLFVGRETELDEIATLLSEHRVVTLAGAGGVGKTQTALRAATAFSDAGESAVCFVGLAPIGDPSLVTTSIATALGVQEVSNHPLLETLVAFLKNKTMLLVLDNCEHVIGAAAVVADFLIRGCPSLRILATSREPLRAAGERAYGLPSLNESEAVTLFADRAQAADARFVLTTANRPAVGEICERLSGIPLAIELAAARMPTLPLSVLTKEFQDRFGVTACERTAPPRQQTMRATIDWSYELLAAPEQRLFERLSAFAGGCTIAAATPVCQGEGIAADDVLPLISSLVSKSLVVANLEGDEPRYRLLEPFREYAREKLEARREGDAIAQRHLLVYLGIAAHFVPHDQHNAVHYGHPYSEMGNWRAAVRWGLIERKDVLGGQRLVAEVVCLWGSTDPVLSDARRWIPAALELVDEQTPRDVIAKLRLAEAELATHLEQQALQLTSAREAVAYYREAGDALRLVRAQTLVGHALYVFGQIDEARSILEEALSTARRLGYRWDTWRVLLNLGDCLMEHDLVASRTYLTEALQLVRAADDQRNRELTLMHFAGLAFEEGDAESALRQLTDLFSDGRDFVTSRRLAINARLWIAEYLMVLGRYEEAWEYASEALTAAREEHLDVVTGQSLAYLVAIAVVHETTCLPNINVEAARILGFVEACMRRMGSAPFFRRDQLFAALREGLGAEAFANLVADGSMMTEDEAVRRAMAL